MQVGEVLGLLTQFFRKKGLEFPQTDAEYLVAQVLGCGRLDLFLNYDRPLSVSQEDTLRTLARRRGKREPLQYILGSVNFYGQELNVDPRVLIPRPETEELIYQLQEHWAEKPPEKVIDLGTGSGAIAITLAASYPQLQLTATDRRADILLLALENAKRNRVEARIRFVCSDWFEKIVDRYDVIIANPPYLSEEEWEQAAPEINKFEPREALVAQEAGLADLKLLLIQGISHLRNEGLILLETGSGQQDYLHGWAQHCGYTRSKTTEDLSKRRRYFWAWR
jgi:release factor glutamine methyltransferase